MEKNGPATKKDLAEMESRVRQEIAAAEARLAKQIRDAQREILHCQENIQTTSTIRLRKIQNELGSLDTATSMRFDLLEH